MENNNKSKWKRYALVLGIGTVFGWYYESKITDFFGKVNDTIEYVKPTTSANDSANNNANQSKPGLLKSIEERIRSIYIVKGDEKKDEKCKLEQKLTPYSR